MNKERIDLLQKYISEEPDNPFNVYALAMEFYEQQPEKAQMFLEELIRNHPGYLPTYFKLAHLYWDLEEWELTDSIFLKGIDLAEKQNDQKALSELTVY